MPCRIGKARSTLILDINVGDPITPGATLIDFPQILDPDPIRLYGYPIETVLAEKLTTVVSLGDLNTREQDWADVWRRSDCRTDLDRLPPPLDSARSVTTLSSVAGEKRVIKRAVPRLDPELTDESGGHDAGMTVQQRVRADSAIEDWDGTRSWPWEHGLPPKTWAAGQR